jgi:hypothetical protein
MRRLHTQLCIAAALCLSAELSAQVGFPPQRSPFRDLERTQEVSFITGWYRAKRDPAQVAPESGPLIGVHYQWRASGPANLTASLSRVESERNVLDPDATATCTTKPNCKVVGRFRWPLYFADVGLALSLTGARSFWHMVPDVKAGIGLASDFRTKSDVGDFGFGTRFAFNWGAGIRWVPGGAYQLRLDFTNHLYSLKYPETYYQSADDNTTILASTQSKSTWLNNPGITIGVSYLFSR